MRNQGIMFIMVPRTCPGQRPHTVGYGLQPMPRGEMYQE